MCERASNTKTANACKIRYSGGGNTASEKNMSPDTLVNVMTRLVIVMLHADVI